MSLTLFSNFGNTRANIILVVSELAQTPLVHQIITSEDLKSEAVLAQNPCQKVPYISTPEGALVSTSAILRFLARKNLESKLAGTTLQSQVLVDQWLEFLNTELQVNVTALLLPVLGVVFQDKENAKAAREETLKLLKVIEIKLTNNFLVGDFVTIADIAIVGALFTLFTIILTPKEREAIPKVVKWVQTVGENAAFKKYFGTLRLCTNEWTVPQAEKKEKDAKQEKKEKAKGQQQEKAKK